MMQLTLFNHVGQAKERKCPGQCGRFVKSGTACNPCIEFFSVWGNLSANADEIIEAMRKQEIDNVKP
jgi:hypothetical protein